MMYILPLQGLAQGCSQKPKYNKITGSAIKTVLKDETLQLVSLLLLEGHTMLTRSAQTFPSQ